MELSSGSTISSSTIYGTFLTSLSLLPHSLEYPVPNDCLKKRGVFSLLDFQSHFSSVCKGHLSCKLNFQISLLFPKGAPSLWGKHYKCISTVAFLPRIRESQVLGMTSSLEKCFQSRTLYTRL